MNMIEKKPIETSQIGYLIEKFGTINVKIIGNSMIPFFCPDDIVEVKRMKPHRHQVILFAQGTKAVLHRVVYIHRKKIVTRGDNSLFFEKIHLQDYLGTVISMTNNHCDTRHHHLGWRYQIGVLCIIVAWRFIRICYIKLHKSPELKDALYERYKRKLIYYNTRWLGRMT